MKIIRYDNPDTTDIVATILNSLDFDGENITVSDVSGLTVNDFILIEELGHEKNEIVKILSINGNDLTITPTQLNHLANTKITKVLYDKYKIQKSITGDIYEDLVINNINYSNEYNIIYYIDDSLNASDSLYYKILYHNTHTNTSLEKAILHNEKNYGYITVEQFRAETAFSSAEVSDSEIEKAIINSTEWIQDNAYVYHEFNGGDDNIFNIDTPLEFADWNGDRIIDKRDIIVYEFNSTTLMRRYLNHKIARIITNSKKLLFKEKIPINPMNQLVIRIPMTFKPLDEIKVTLSNIAKLIATNSILKDVDTSKIKQGVSSWTAGGTSVNRDMSSLKDSIEKNLTEARRLLTQVCKIYVRATKLRTTQSSLNYRQRYSNRYTEVSRRY